MIRYEGLYARHRDSDKKLIHAIHKSKHSLYRSFSRWKYAILLAFGYNPLSCPVCGSDMKFLSLYYNHKRVFLEDLFEKLMYASRGRFSSA